jgi:hypothetical protein
MNTLTVHGLFAAFTPEQRQEAMPGEFTAETPVGQIDVWPLAAAAAVSMSGQLPNLETQELAAALAQFRREYENGLYNHDDWEAEMRGILMDLHAWGQQQELSSGSRPPMPAFSAN